MEDTIFDITDAVIDPNDTGIIKAEAKGSNVLILRELNKPFNAYPKDTYCHYQLEYRWLSKTIETEQDVENENYVCVLGQDFTYCTKKEVKGFEEKSLFDLFNLF